MRVWVRWTTDRVRGMPALLVATVLGVAVLGAGCQGEPIGPDPSPSASTTSASPSPTPSGTPAPTFEPNEQAAIAEAETAYRNWWASFTRLAQAPQNYTLEELRVELYKVGGDPLARESMRSLSKDRDRGVVQKGAMQVQDLQPVSTELARKQGSYPEVQLRACTDSASVRLVFSETGKPAAIPPKKSRFVRHVVVWFYEAAWHVVRNEIKDTGEEC